MSKIEKDIINAIKDAVKNTFPGSPEGLLPDIYLEVPKEKRFGDFSTNVAMRLAREIKKAPGDIAKAIVGEIRKTLKQQALSDAIQDIKIEKPAFINFYISTKAAIFALEEILAQGDKFGRLSLGKRKKIQVEFVSANPTGPLTVAHGRQAAIGDSLAGILEFCGYRVTREYYINDEGIQMDILGKSVEARFAEITGQGSDFPEDGYKGEYIYEIAKEIHELPETKKRALRHKLRVRPEFIEGRITTDFFVDYACKWIMCTIKKDLKDFGVNFDEWYSQKGLSRSGNIKKALMILQDKGFMYEKDGAIWFRSTEFGDDKDRVVIKNDGSFTYLAPDVAYHREKFEKGYHRLINIWGPDHHGYVNRIRAACQALGYEKDRLSILISQLVTLYRDKKPVRMSTRQGEFVTLRQIIDEVGKDAARFFFIMRRTDSHLDFDLALAKARTMDNPVYYIQYAYARIVNVIKFSGDAKLDLKTLHLLDKPEETNLIKSLMQYPKIIYSSAHNLEPYILLSYLQNLASLFHSYYDAYRIVTDDHAITKARIVLIKALKTVLLSGLALLGVSAPDKM